MLANTLFGTVVCNLEDMTKTREVIVQKINSVLPYQNISFRDNSKKISIDTVGEGKHFQAFEIDSEKDWCFTSKGSPLKIKNIDDFAELILNYSDDKLNNYEEDKLYNMKDLIDKLTNSEKDDLLFALMSKEVQ